jgi:hypothetical protein
MIPVRSQKWSRPKAAGLPTMVVIHDLDPPDLGSPASAGMEVLQERRRYAGAPASKLSATSMWIIWS